MSIKLALYVVCPIDMITKFSKMEKIGAIREENSLTCIEDFSDMIDHLLSINATGVYNCCNKGVITPYEIGLLVKKYINSDLHVTKIEYEDLLRILPNRRVNTILSCDKLVKSGYIPRTAREALLWCVSGYDKND